MNITYIGKGGVGETCRMRFDCMRELLPEAKFTLIDTSVPERECGRLSRSLAWRFKAGPMIGHFNRYILEHLPTEKQQLIWVDKGIFICPDTTGVLRERAEKLVHFTPDPAFTYHRSRLFFQSLGLYDFLVTTKSYEMKAYTDAAKDSAKVLYATQGFQKKLHRPVCAFEQKRGVVFLGHYEKEREAVIAALLKAGIPVTLAGIHWDDFAERHKSASLNYLGKGVFGEDYVKTVSGALFGYGSVSKWIPERHTTRTFEIPACGTALLTEKNDEIASFYKDDEVIYYENTDDLIAKIRYYSEHLDELKMLTERGHQAVIAGGYDYTSIMKKLLDKIFE